MSDTESANKPAESAEAATEAAQNAGASADAGHSEAGQGGAAVAATVAPKFDADELKQFAADDSLAGSVIGKMLSLLFIYTLIAMSLVSWWTWDSVFK